MCVYKYYFPQPISLHVVAQTHADYQRTIVVPIVSVKWTVIRYLKDEHMIQWAP